MRFWKDASFVVVVLDDWTGLRSYMIAVGLIAFSMDESSRLASVWSVEDVMRSLIASICSSGTDAVASPVSKLSHVASSKDVACSMDSEQVERLSFASFARARDAAGVEQTDALFGGASSDVFFVSVPASASSRPDEETSAACGRASTSSMVDRRVGLRRMPRILPMVYRWS